MISDYSAAEPHRENAVHSGTARPARRSGAAHAAEPYGNATARYHTERNRASSMGKRGSLAEALEIGMSAGRENGRARPDTNSATDMTGVTRAGTLQRDDGPTIAYDVTGHGPLVVFLHGLTSFRQTWDPVTTLLAEEFTCVRLDLRGHGGSSRAAEYSMVSLVGDVRAVVEEMALGEPAIVGHSLGASIAAVYAAAHGARAVVCVDESLRFGELAGLVQAHADQLRSQRTMDAVLSIDRALKLKPYTGVKNIERRVLKFPREVVLGIWDALLNTPPEQLTAIAEAALPRITAPLLSLHGSPPPPDYTAWLTGLALHAHVETWDGTGHMLHLVHPEQFAARVRPLLLPSRHPQ